MARLESCVCSCTDTSAVKRICPLNSAPLVLDAPLRTSGWKRLRKAFLDQFQPEVRSGASRTRDALFDGQVRMMTVDTSLQEHVQDLKRATVYFQDDRLSHEKDI